MFNKKVLSMKKWILPAFALGSFFMAACSDGKDTAGTSEESEGITAVKDLDVAGVSQKGPFVKGSAVTVQGIDCKTMKFSDEIFEGIVKSDKGDFAIDDVTLSSTCAVFSVTGAYRDELTGKRSADEITLHALTDLNDRKNVNINMLTELEYERVMNLVTEKNKTFANAKMRAEKEVLAAFGIEGDFDNSEDLTIYKSGDGNAALLAVSVLMLAETDDAGLAKRIEKFADSFTETGKWSDDKTKAAIEEWQVAATADGTLDSIRKNVESWGYADVVPAFEKYVEAFVDIPASNNDGESSSSVVQDPGISSGINTLEGSSSSFAKADTGSEYDASANTLKDLRDGKVYKTVKIGNQVWMAENLNYEADSSHCYNDSAEYCAKYGRLYPWSVAMGSMGTWSANDKGCSVGSTCSPTYPVRGVCPSSWHLPTVAEWETLFAEVGGTSIAGKMLKDSSGWNYDADGTDDFGFSALPAGSHRYDEIYEGYDKSAYFLSSTEYDEYNSYSVLLDYTDEAKFYNYYKFYGNSVRCVMDGGSTPVSSSSEETSSSSSSVTLATPCKTETEDNCEYGEIVDTRDGQTYKTVKVGDRVWMAENLNYKTESSFCYNDTAEYCTKYGRLYTWAAAIDSVKLANDAENPQNCGYGETCTLPAKVQGVCPPGWYLPTYREWNELFTAVDGRLTAGEVLKSQTGWNDRGNGTDAFGLSMLSVGYRDDNGSYNDDGRCSYFWSAKEIGDNAYRMYLYDNVKYAGLSLENKGYGFSVRCLKD